MPDPQRQLPRGQGTFDPEFTSRVEPIREQEVARVQETQFEQFEKAMINIGSGFAGSLQSLADQARGLARLKDQAVARQDKIMSQIAAGQAAGQRSMQERRLNDIKQDQQKLLIEAPDHDPEWLFKRVRTSFNNAASQEEQAMWSELLIGSRSLADKFKISEEKEHDNQIIQQFAMAGQTAQQAVGEMVSTLQQDTELQRELMGNGVGIHQRVQDWILSEAATAAPDIFDIDRSDPDRELKLEQRDQLIAALVENSLPVGDQLIRQHTGVLDASAFQTGADLLGASLLAFYNGKLGIDSVKESIQSISKLHFNHLPDIEKQQKFKQFLADSIDAATSGQFGSDVGDIEDKVTSIINSGPYNEFEKASLNSMAAARLADMATKNYITEVQRATLARTVEMPIVGGSTLQTTSAPDPNASVTLSIPNDEGFSEFDRIADQTIIDAGLDIDPSFMTPVQVEAASQIRETALQLNIQGQTQLSKKISAKVNIDMVAIGDPGGDPTKAYDNGLIMAAFSSSVSLNPSQVRRILQVNEQVQNKNQKVFGEKPVNPGQVWDGQSPIPATKETRSLREAVYRMSKDVWDNPDSRSGGTKLPENLVTNFTQKWTEGNTEGMADTLYFTSMLTEPRQNDIYKALGHNSAEALALRMAIHNHKKTANNRQFAMPIDDLMDTARQRMATGDPNKFLDGVSSFGGDFAGQKNVEIASAVFAELLYMKGLDTATDSKWLGLSHEPSEVHNERMSALQLAFLQSETSDVDDMFNLWSLRIQETQDTPEEAAQWVYGNMQDSGFRIVNMDGDIRLVEDPREHFGLESPTSKEYFVGTTQEIQEITTFSERVAAYAHSPMLAWQSTVVQKALGLSVHNRPVTMAGIYARLDVVNPLFIRDTQGRVDTGIQFVVSDPRHTASQSTLRKSADHFGGIILQPMTRDGRLLPLARAKFPVDFIDSNGVQHSIQIGEPLSVFSDHLFSLVVKPVPFKPVPWWLGQ